MQKNARIFGSLLKNDYLSKKFLEMRKALFVIFHGFDSNNGISKKVFYQVNALKACGLEVHLCYMDETSGKKRLIDGQIIADYGDGIISKIIYFLKKLQISRRKMVLISSIYVPTTMPVFLRFSW